jgi:glycerol-3-phosphate O-acyltransferase
MSYLSRDKMFNQKSKAFTGYDALKTLRNMKGEQLGKVMVKFSTPISLNNFTAHGSYDIY